MSPDRKAKLTDERKGTGTAVKHLPLASKEVFEPAGVRDFDTTRYFSESDEKQEALS
jgi:hypothetical protein